MILRDPSTVSLKKRINRRAWAWAKEVYKQYRDELLHAIRDEGMPAEEIEGWSPRAMNNVIKFPEVGG